MILFFISIYNKFQTNMIAINEAEASIDSELRKRFDLLNKSIKVIVTYAKHEKEVLEEITKLRSRRLNNIELNNELDDAIQTVYGIAEGYVDLKSNKNFLKLQDSITDVEEHLSGCRKFYNHKVSIYNSQVKKFPSNIIAFLFKYKEKPYFDQKENTTE